MDKNAIKKYAVWARRELISRVVQRAGRFDVTKDGWGDKNSESVNGHVLSDAEKKQRIAFIEKVQREGFEQTVEEIAYTWFNRFCALRYMEVNGYLPSHVRVFSNDSNIFKPQIIDEALHLDLDGLDMEKVLKLKENANRTEDLFRYLLITQCNALNSVLPGMFQKIEDYTELLLPDNLLREGSVIDCLIADIPEEDWTDQVQIIGWLYQYYNAEKKDEVFADLKKNIKITKENIPAATQLFTPDWIVRYMVENSLGRLWLEGHPNDRERFIAKKKEDELGGKQEAEWKYYPDEAEQEPEVEEQLAKIRKEYAAIKPEEILCIDPCAGSGHIICYMFDVLMQIYESYGYTTTEAVSSIVENNLYGLDIDERAAQLAYFAVMMKARSYDRRFFSGGIQPHVYAIPESNDLDKSLVDYFVGNDPKLKKDFGTLAEELHDAKEYGSILNVSQVDFDAMLARAEEIKNAGSLYLRPVADLILPLIQAGQVLAQKYDVVVTNPPYMGSGNMGPKLSEFVKKNYPDSKSDLFAVFMERCGKMTAENGYQAMITQHAWMFLSSFEKLREKIMRRDIVSMAHLGPRAFEEIGGEVVQTTSFVLRQSHTAGYKGTYCRLIEPTTQQGKEDLFLAGENRYTAQQSNFSKIPGSPVAYWVSEAVYNLFTYPSSDSVVYLREGIHTGKNEIFLREWYEVDFQKVVFHAESYSDIDSRGRWIPYSKGGNYRKWYGNNELVVGFDAEYRNQMKQMPGHVRPSESLYFKEGATWSALSSGKFGLRYHPQGHLFDSKGQVAIGEKFLEIMGLFNTNVYQKLADILMPTLDYKCGDVKKLPYCHIEKDSFQEIVKENIRLSKTDWDAFETSWDFACHPLVRPAITLAEAFSAWKTECDERFARLKANEEELNRIFIDIYDLQDELTPEEDDKDVTVRKADLQRDVKSLISYAVGCMFGRYSLDVDGLAYAGGEWDASKYKTYQPDYNSILPICDDEYFTDDIVGHFVDFIRTVYGEENLEENLQFIADALGGTGSSREIIRKYFLNDFYKDHCKIYQKRPIYWLFDSGKKNGFKCLIYIHRYRPDTIARIRTDYVHEQQSRYRTAIADLENRMINASTSDRIKMNKQLKKLQDQSEEIHDYEEKIHHLADQFIDIDLDDGVKVNYAKFQDVLAKIK